MADLKKHLSVFSIIGILLIIIGIIWFIHNIYKNNKVNRIASWDRALATVIESGARPVGTNAFVDMLEPKALLISQTSDVKYTPYIYYKYRVDGREYTGDKLMYSSPRNFSAIDTASLLKNLPRGATFPVHYDSNDPSESYVYPGSKEYTGMIIGTVLFLLGLALLFLHARSVKKTQDNDEPLEFETRDTYIQNKVPDGMSRYRSYLQKLY